MYIVELVTRLWRFVRQADKVEQLEKQNEEMIEEWSSDYQHGFEMREVLEKAQKDLELATDELHRVEALCYMLHQTLLYSIAHPECEGIQDMVVAADGKLDKAKEVIASHISECMNYSSFHFGNPHTNDGFPSD